MKCSGQLIKVGMLKVVPVIVRGSVTVTVSTKTAVTCAVDVEVYAPVTLVGMVDVLVL